MLAAVCSDLIAFDNFAVVEGGSGQVILWVERVLPDVTSVRRVRNIGSVVQDANASTCWKDLVRPF